MKKESFKPSVIRISIVACGIFIVSFLMSIVAEAQSSNRNTGGLFVEPAITYELGESKVDYPAPFGSTDTETNGFGLGARLGVHLGEIIFLGADGRYSMPKFKSKNASDDSKVDAKAYNVGPTLGVQTPFAGIRLWGTYILDGALDPKSLGNGLDVKFKDMEGYRVGAGIYVGIVSVNLEFQKAKYDSVDLEKVGPFSGPEDIKSVNLDDESYIVSVSFPIAL